MAERGYRRWPTGFARFEDWYLDKQTWNHVVARARKAAAKAVRNRRDLLAGEIERAVERGGAVTSLACGPAYFPPKIWFRNGYAYVLEPDEDHLYAMVRYKVDIKGK